MIGFAIGVFVGFIIGVCVVAMLSASKCGDCRIEDMKNRKGIENVE